MICGAVVLLHFSYIRHRFKARIALQFDFLDPHPTGTADKLQKSH